MLRRDVIVLILCLSILNVHGYGYNVNNNGQQYTTISNRKPLEKQLIYGSTVYVLNEAINIKTTIDIPENCTLLFTGQGRIEGSGSLIGNNTYICKLL